MSYNVVGADGKEYGPVEVAQLQTWMSEGRLTPQSDVKDFLTGQRMKLSDVPGMNPASAPQPGPIPPGMGQGPNPYANPPSNTYAAYPRPGQMQPSQDYDNAHQWAMGGIILRCVLSLLLFFVLGGFGLIIAAYGVIYAFRLKQANSRFGNIALIISIGTVVVVGIGFALRMSGVLPPGPLGRGYGYGSGYNQGTNQGN